MKIVIRRSAMTATRVESEESLAEFIEIGDVHALLYERGDGDLADALTAHLGPREARTVADRLRSLARRESRSGLFRDYRAALRPDGAARVGLVAMWYERAGRAGCRAWADLREELHEAAPVALVPAAIDIEPGARTPSGAVSGRPHGAGIMPEWLDAPDTSVWSA